MINIKATKAQPQSAEPSRERYVQKAGAVLGKMPMHLSMILTAAVLYLQSFLRASATEAAAPDDGQAAPPETPAVAAVPAAGPMAEPQPDRLDESSVDAATQSEAPSFVMLDSPTIEFPATSVAVRTQNGTFEFRPRSSNDNIGVTGLKHSDPAFSSA